MKSDAFEWSAQPPRPIAGGARHSPPFGADRGGFSLVEVVLALGIVSFAMVGIMGLLPVGLDAFRQSINLTVESQIAQQIINNAQVVPYDKLAGYTHFYDENGSEVASGDPQQIYTATVSLTNPAASLTANLPHGITTTLVVTISNKTQPQEAASHSFVLVKNN